MEGFKQESLQIKSLAPKPLGPHTSPTCHSPDHKASAVTGAKAYVSLATQAQTQESLFYRENALTQA